MLTNIDIWKQHEVCQAKQWQANIKKVEQDFISIFTIQFYPAYSSLESCSITFVCKNSVKQTLLTWVPYSAGQLGLHSSCLLLIWVFFLEIHLHRIYPLIQESGNSRWSARTCLSWFHFTKSFGPHSIFLFILWFTTLSRIWCEAAKAGRSCVFSLQYEQRHQ